jgi:D-alanine-D-alanine ligase-like ATP-grasp enzyme
MKICVIEADLRQSTAPYKDYAPLAEVGFYFGQYTWERHLLQKQTACERVSQLARQDFDVFLNLCDGELEEDIPGIEVIQTIEQLGLAFTGATSVFYAPTRQTFKSMCYDAGVLTPRYWVAEDRSDPEKIAATLHFPLILKHPSRHCSVGLTPASCVHTLADLRQELEQSVAEYGGALVEEFIHGREFTVLVVENADDESNPTVYRPIEILFPTGETFKHFSLKWKDCQGMQSAPCFDPHLANRLEEISKNLFTVFHGTGYTRFDVRMNAAGELFIIDINPNCGIFGGPGQEYSADDILKHDPRGHQHFIAQILRSAFKRRDEHLKKQRDGVYATRSIRTGSLDD